MLGEDLRFDCVDVFLHPVRDDEIGVDDAVEDRVHHRPRSELEQLRLALQFGADRRQRSDFAMPDCDHVVRPDEHHQVAGLDDLAGLGELAVLDVAGGPHHQEGHPAVLLDLCPLAALRRVLDRELVQFEDRGDVSQVAERGLVQTEPDEGVFPVPGGLQVPGHSRSRPVGARRRRSSRSRRSRLPSRARLGRRGADRWREHPGHGAHRCRDRPADPRSPWWCARPPPWVRPLPAIGVLSRSVAHINRAPGEPAAAGVGVERPAHPVPRGRGEVLAAM